MIYGPFSKPRPRLQSRLWLAWPRGCFDIWSCFAYVLRAPDERTEPEAESKAEAVDSKKVVASYFSTESVLMLRPRTALEMNGDRNPSIWPQIGCLPRSWRSATSHEVQAHCCEENSTPRNTIDQDHHVRQTNIKSILKDWCTFCNTKHNVHRFTLNLQPFEDIYSRKRTLEYYSCWGAVVFEK